jgi:uncharacterized protein (DUF2147 family)
VRIPRAAWRLLLTAALLALPITVLGADADAIIGLWNTSDNDARIEIYRCGTAYCGRISEIDEPRYPVDDEKGMAGLPRVDRNNPDPRLRNRPLVGLMLLEGFRWTGNNSWEGGRIYSPENGKRYKALIGLTDKRHLLLRGYVGISLLGRTETWVRVVPDHGRQYLSSAQEDPGDRKELTR